MAVSNIKATFQSDIQSVWEVVTSLENYAWRSDLGKIEVKNENQFIEYTKDGYATTFTVTKEEPYERWEFDMENDNMKGHWTGVFMQKNGQTEIDFTEDVIRDCDYTFSVDGTELTLKGGTGTDGGTYTLNKK